MTRAYADDAELFATLRRELFTAVIGDCLDKMGFLHQFLPPAIMPVRDDMVVIGRAMPVLEADVLGETLSPAAGAPGERAFGLMLDALDDLAPGEVYVAAGASPRYALWGELMTIRARHLGATGVVADGYVRDVEGIAEQGFPCFAYGAYAQDQAPRGRVIDYRTTVEVGGVRIAPGDLVFGDREGVLIVPRDAEDEAIGRAIEKARGETRVAEAIAGGMSAAEAFATFGIL